VIDRRHFLGAMLMSSASAALPQGATEVPLPPPQGAVPTTLLEALRKRRSTREFASGELPREMLSMLLWCAFGINRPESGGRTAPSAHNWQEIEVFVALAEGAFRYVPRRHALQPVADADLRPATGAQDFVGRAPLNLVYVADFGKMVDASAEDRTFYAAADAGFVAQNVYLYCAATGLACVVRGLVDRRKLAPLFKLTVDQRIVLAQTVGFPA
jgi:SagB-type dehydrogenase family enzyme